MNVPRKQRNQSSSNNDIEFAAEITTSLLGQVRHLQAVLAERDESLKTISAEKSKLELDAEGFSQRLKHLDDSEQRYKDENWNLETQLQDFQTSTKESTAREHRLQQSLAAATSGKINAQQELDELKQKYGKMIEDYSSARKVHESELAGLRKDYNFGENERTGMQRKVEELTSQNREMATVLQNRLREEHARTPIDIDPALEEDSLVLSDRDPSPPPSPTKGGQRHSMLESETLKSSLTHAHRMIQNLKGNVSREKSEKMELKRMLQEARDELDIRRSEPSEKRLKPRSQQDNKKPLRAGLGAVRMGRTDILDDDPEKDPAWEETSGETPSRDLSTRQKRRDTTTATAAAPDSSDAYQTANETEDAFETANERDTTDNDAFQTGAESMADVSSDDLTETEDIARSGTLKGRRPSPLSAAKPGDRNSLQSTASTSDDEEHTLHTPLQGQAQRFRLKMNRNRRSRVSSGAADSNPSSTKNSPASYVNGGDDTGQSLAAELENLSGEEDGTPSKSGVSTPKSSYSTRRIAGEKRSSTSLRRAPGSQPPTPRAAVPSAIYTEAPPLPRMPMVDSGMMTEPWETPQEKDAQVSPSKRSSRILSRSAVGSITSRIFGTSSPSTPQNKGIVLEPNGDSASTSTSTPSRQVWDQPGNTSSVSESVDSTPLSTRSMRADQNLVGGEKTQSLSSGETTEVLPAPLMAQQPRQLSFSPINNLDTPPIEALVSPPLKTESPLSNGTSATQEQEAGSAGILGSVSGWGRSIAGSSAPTTEYDNNKGLEPANKTTTKANKKALQEVEANAVSLPSKSKGVVEGKRPIGVLKNDQGSQTLLSSEQIENLLGARNVKPANDNEKTPTGPVMKPLADIGAVTPSTPSHQGIVPEVRIPEGSNGKNVKRPSSAASTRSRISQHPPLPPDHQEAIAAASQRDSTGSVMGPPLAPASAYPRQSWRSRTSSRPQTPSQQGYPSPSSKGGTTPRASRFSTRSQTSRRSSISSFASELDERFNMRDGMLMPQDVQGTTDPRMIQAITQTMIGEMMWKYTRKAGRGEMSNTRHPRFFWVHPYTRTLYWSDRDPVTANRAELKSKSVAIEAVRVVTDDNPMPPGLHRKSLIVVTPGRSVKFTAQTSQRHETWFNALSYLLLRNGTDGTTNNDAGDLTEADVQEFNPMSNYNRNSRSRVSLTSFRSQATANRNLQSSLASRAPANSLASRQQGQPPTLLETGESDEGRLSLRKRVSRSLSRTRSRPTGKAPEERASSASYGAAAPKTEADSSYHFTSSHRPQHASISSRISSYWKNPDTASGNRSSVRSRSSVRAEAVNEPGVLEGGRSVVSINGANDSAEDLRKVIEDREQKGDLENVRSCCDGML